ncbi:stAR-related lipid transfer protein 7, mitochondrial-like [Anneissia japonica]|uniref:stAR-related lipid transfer protein 7, mitochondrial-like n=1 Tax=Anneissia japonica TaxID=1529436 RepID=UPI001425B74D|nr:stAR-related lipid transfer protein 7, mitochondrial-like [Anneissia japonica]XP_033122416.1 stAR-related lipid transfer protein 7, mitochondrial-like [Anneissia japonica]
MFRQVITPRRCRPSAAVTLQWRAASSQSRPRPSLNFLTWTNLVKLLTKPCAVALPRLVARQINVYAMKKFRRIEQILIRHYNNFYSERAIQNLASSFQRSNWCRDRRRPFYILFGGACFAWHDDRLSENDFKQCQDDLEGIDFFANTIDTVPDVFNTWETVINRDHLKAWRKQLGNTHLYEYKLFCRFFDISAKDFFQVQWDLDYRRKWDKLAVKLNLVCRESPNSDIIHWVLRYPYPMYNRDYVYHRRYFIDKDKNLIIIFNKSTEHANVPENTNIVRVSNYYSHMIIRPHFSMEENGFDFIMTYHDDPRTNFPPSCINWMSTTGVPDYVEKLHQATLQLSNTSNIVHLSSSDNQQQNHNPGQYST